MNIDTKNLFQSKTLKRILFTIGILVVALLIFKAGLLVGYRKAEFSYRWGDTYYRVFGEHRGSRGGPFVGIMGRGDFLDAHGLTGKIIKISAQTLVIEGQDGVEKSVEIKNDTIIRRFREAVAPGDLKAGDLVVVIGSPNDQGQIDAELIRLVPSLPGFSMSTSTSL